MTRKEYLQNYYQTNKSKLDSANKEYALKHIDEIREYRRNYMRKRRADIKLSQPEILKEQSKNRYYKEKDGYQYVYLLEDYNYVGVTDCLYFRFNNHKHQNNRDCTNHKILLKTKDREEALKLELEYHNMGYSGKHSLNSYK